MTKQFGENNKTRIVRMFAPYVSKSAVERVSNTLQSGYIGEGPVVAEFENGFNTFIGTGYGYHMTNIAAAIGLANLEIVGRTGNYQYMDMDQCLHYGFLKAEEVLSKIKYA